MNILHESAFNKDIYLQLHVYDDDYTLYINGYKFYINESDVDYPIIDRNIYRNIIKDLHILYNMRTS